MATVGEVCLYTIMEVHNPLSRNYTPRAKIALERDIIPEVASLQLLLYSFPTPG